MATPPPPPFLFSFRQLCWVQSHMAKHGLGVLLGTAYYFTGRASQGEAESTVLYLTTGILQNLSLHPANR